MGQSQRKSDHLDNDFYQSPYSENNVCQSQVGPFNANTISKLEQNKKQLGYQLIMERVTKEVTGLPNLGNTCFLNSIIQLLISSKYLRQKIVFSKQNQSLNQKYKNQIFTYLKEIFSTIVLNQGQSKKKEIMTKITNFLKHNNCEYQSFSQQDSLQFLMFILNKLFKSFKQLQKCFTIQFQLKCPYCGKSDIYQEFTLTLDKELCTKCGKQKQIVFLNQPKLIIIMSTPFSRHQSNKQQIFFRNIKKSNEIYCLKAKILYSGDGSSGHYIALRKKINLKQGDNFFQFNDSTIVQCNQKRGRSHFVEKVCLYELKQIQNSIKLENTKLIKNQQELSRQNFKNKNIKNSTQQSLNEYGSPNLVRSNIISKQPISNHRVYSPPQSIFSQQHLPAKDYFRLQRSQQCHNQSIDRNQMMNQLPDIKYSQFSNSGQISMKKKQNNIGIGVPEFKTKKQQFKIVSGIKQTEKNQVQQINKKKKQQKIQVFSKNQVILNNNVQKQINDTPSYQGSKTTFKLNTARQQSSGLNDFNYSGNSSTSLKQTSNKIQQIFDQKTIFNSKNTLKKVQSISSDANKKPSNVSHYEYQNQKPSIQGQNLKNQNPQKAKIIQNKSIIKNINSTSNYSDNKIYFTQIKVYNQSHKMTIKVWIEFEIKKLNQSKQIYIYKQQTNDRRQNQQRMLVHHTDLKPQHLQSLCKQYDQQFKQKEELKHKHLFANKYKGFDGNKIPTVLDRYQFKNKNPYYNFSHH